MKQLHMLSFVGQLCVLALIAVPAAATVIELVAANYTDYLSGLPADTNCVIEYYAHWCPWSQRFMPVYDEVGSHFLDVPEPVVQVARIDCANERESCPDIHGYPTVLFGKATQYLSAVHDGRAASGLFYAKQENAKTAEEIVQHIVEYFNLTDTDVPAATVHVQEPASAAGTAPPAAHGRSAMLWPAWQQAAAMWNATTTAVLRLLPGTAQAGVRVAEAQRDEVIGEDE